jgi:hypothetical protein
MIEVAGYIATTSRMHICTHIIHMHRTYKLSPRTVCTVHGYE